jgi:hypothetical protein
VDIFAQKSHEKALIWGIIEGCHMGTFEMKNSRQKLKTCSRGHTYTGAGPCPICWPGNKKKKSKV